ncbi:hypothetical protein [Georgenia muralis]|uniref:Uncharacterized protein n=1 Tax=Georgenia muralis TaxID=154117 RepID=A0A3N4ZAF5_9MICO|nr:hypothetical protein [Georgenia muralis]RPF29103.1 hypothetical protein EDD32_3663 [Georgenia muralis]
MERFAANRAAPKEAAEVAGRAPRADVTQADDAAQEYLDACLASLARDPEAPLPEPETLRRLLGGPLSVGHAVVDDGVAPARALCPDGSSGDCWREQRREGGRTYWVWVCSCH